MTKTPCSKKLLIGAHTSAAGGVHHALLHGKAIGATTIQLFTNNQRRWTAKPLAPEEIALWEETLVETGLQKIMSHDSYLINLGSPDKEVLRKSQHAFQEEIERCLALNLAFLNFHPGAATSSSKEACLAQIIDSLLSYAPLLEHSSLRLLLETTAGQGSAVGAAFEEIGYLISHLAKKIPLGVCIDTCHIFAAGYDIRTKEGWDKTLQAFEKAIGLQHLYAMHVNDSVHPLGSRKDRHACLGKGAIGLAGFKAMMENPQLCDIPKYLETPDEENWKEEIALLRKLGGEK